jgi:hypothetical protein
MGSEEDRVRGRWSKFKGATVTSVTGGTTRFQTLLQNALFTPLVF